MGTRKTTGQANTKLTTFMADLGRVVRSDLDYTDSFSFCFVLDKVLQLEIAPVANPVVHASSSSNGSYAFEVFHNDFVSIIVGNDVLADAVVCPSHITSFSSAYLLEKTFGGTSAFSLKLGAQELELPLNLLDFAGIIKSAVRTDSKIIYSEVDAKNGTLRATVDGIDLFREREQEVCRHVSNRNTKTLPLRLALRGKL